MATQDLSTVYRWILDDVIAKVKPDFVQEGVEESVLLELRSAWEEKLKNAGMLDANVRGSTPELASGSRNPPINGNSITDQQNGKGNNWAGGDVMPTSDVNADGADVRVSESQEGGALKRRKTDGDPSQQLYKKAKEEIPQQDGSSEEPDGRAGPSNEVGEAGRGEDPGSDNLSDVSVGSSDEDADGGGTENYLCALFDKCGRTKNRWKAQMKAGVFVIDGRDYMFCKASGEFSF